MGARATFDADEVTAEVRKRAARHEQLHDRLSRVIGPVADYATMTSSELAAYGLEKLGVEVPEGEEAAVTALEYFLHGRANRAMGRGATGMDGAAETFLDRYLKE